VHRDASADDADDEPSLIGRVESQERRATRDFIDGDYGPTLADLGFSDADLAVWRVSREAAQTFIRGRLARTPFDKLVRGRQPRVESVPFAYELARRVDEWRSGRRTRSPRRCPSVRTS